MQDERQRRCVDALDALGATLVSSVSQGQKRVQFSGLASPIGGLVDRYTPTPAKMGKLQARSSKL